MESEGVNLLECALEKSTLSGYMSIWLSIQCFVRTVLNLKVVLPLPVFIIVKYIHHLYNKRYALGTVKSHLSVISFVHKVRFMQSPCENFVIPKI